MARPVWLLSALVLLAAVPARAQVASAPPVIVTEGEATIHRAPDRAWVSVSTETRDPKADTARRESADAMTAVESAVKTAGIPPDAIRTTGYALVPDTEWTNGRSVNKGYVVRNDIEIRVDDLDKLATVLDTVNSSRGSTVSITGPRFDLKDQEAAEQDALKLAVGVALARAQAIAAGAHTTLGPLLRIEESTAGGSIRPLPMSRALVSAPGAAVETPIDPGEIDVTAQVTLTVEMR